MRYLISVLLIGAVVIGNDFLYAEKVNDVSEIYYRSGATKYAKGDLAGAIGDMEEAYRSAPESKKVKELFAQLLTEQGIRLYESARYKEAEFNLERAVKLNPGLDKANQYFKLVHAKLAPPEPPKEIVIQKEEIPAKKENVAPKPHKFNVAAHSEKTKKNIEVSQLQTPAITAVPEVPVKVIVEKQSFLSKNSGQVLIIGLSIGIVIIVLVISAGIMVLARSWQKQQKQFVSKMEKIMTAQFNTEKVLVQGKSHLTTNTQHVHDGRISIAEMLQDSNPRIRAKGVEIMELELVNEEHKIAEQLLEPYLNDTHNRVRANAAKALFVHNSDKAKSMLEKMINNEDKWMRASAAWAIGEIGNVESGYEMLKPLLNNPDFHVKRQVLKTLEKLRANEDKTKTETSGAKEDQVPQEAVKQKIKTAGYGYINVRVREGNGVGAEKMEKEAVEINDILHSPVARLRARGLELIESELHNEPPEVAQKLLRSYLDDKNHRVKSIAAKILYAFYPDQAIYILKKMVSSPSKYDRLAAIWALESILIIDELKKWFQPLLNDPDFHVRKRVMKVLHETENYDGNKIYKKRTDKPLSEKEKTRWVYLDVDHRLFH